MDEARPLHVRCCLTKSCMGSVDGFERCVCDVDGWMVVERQEYWGLSMGGVESITLHLTTFHSFFLCTASDHAMRQARMIAMRFDNSDANSFLPLELFVDILPY